MNKTITIFGDITEDMYSDFLTECLSVGESDTLTVCIDSFGGLLDVGWMMYNDLKTLQDNGTYVQVLVDKYCMSSAVLPLLAVPVSRRFVRENSKILIHQPYFQMEQGTSLTIQALDELKDDLRASVQQLESVYADTFECANSLQIRTMMENEQVINATLAVRLGIVGSILRTKQNKSLFNNRLKPSGVMQEAMINKKIIKNMNKKNQSILDRLIQVLSQNDLPKLNLMVVSEEGVEISVPSKDEGEELEVGDKVEGVDDGVYNLPDNTVITITEGKIADIQKKEEEELPEPEEPTDTVPAQDKMNEASEATIVNEEEEPVVVAPYEGPSQEDFDSLVSRVSALEETIKQLIPQVDALEENDKSFKNLFRGLKNAVNPEPDKQQATVIKDYDYYKKRGVF